MKNVVPVYLIVAIFAGCSSDTGPLRATWNYVELTKDDNGEIKEVGDKHTLRSGGDEMVEIQGMRLEVVSVTSAHAKSRLTSGETRGGLEVELQPGASLDHWFGSFGVRLRVEKIGPL